MKYQIAIHSTCLLTIEHIFIDNMHMLKLSITIIHCNTTAQLLQTQCVMCVNKSE